MDEQVSLHEKVSEHLKNEIIEGYYEPGDKLPSEKTLCNYFDVSRVTIRHAMQNLEHAGLIYRKQGVGAFVKDYDMPKNLVRLTDFSEDMRKAGFESSSRLITLKKVDPISEINKTLELRPDMNLIRVDRVRLANEKPVAFDITWMPPSYGQLLFDENLTTRTIYEVLEEKYDIPIIAGRYKITASNADEYVAEHLNLETGSAVLEIDRCSRSTGNKKIYFQKRYYNPEHVMYEVELSRNEDTDISSKEGLPLKEFMPKFA